MKTTSILKTLTGAVMIIYLAIILFTLASCHARAGQAGGPGGPGGGPGGPPSGPAPTKVAKVYSGPATVYYSFPAVIQGEQNVEIRPKVDGFIQKIFVDEGATVHKGQPLFQLNNPQYAAAIRTALANVRIAQADVQTAEMDVEKVKPLIDQKILSAYELKSNQLVLQSKQASLAAAEADLVNARVNEGYTLLLSPSEGVMGTIPYKVGSLVSSSSTNPLSTVYNTKNLYAYFSLNEKQLLEFLRTVKGKSLQDKLATMADVSLVLADGTEYPLKGRVVTASGLISTETGSVSFRANFPNNLGLIHSGSSASIKLPVRIDSAMAIPQTATFELQGKKFVYTVGTKDSLISEMVQVSANTIG